MNTHADIFPRQEGTRHKDPALVLFTYCDNAGIIRAKGVPFTHLEQRMHTGVGCTVAMQAVTCFDGLALVEGMGPVGEFRLMPDRQTLVPLPYALGMSSMLCDLTTPAGEPWEACPRHFLKRMLERLDAWGMRALVGVEHEFTLAVPSVLNLEPGHQASYVPADHGLLFGTEGLLVQYPFVQRLLDGLAQQQLPLALLHTEYGPGQMELSLEPAPVLEAADRVCLVRELVRGVARTAGLTASFAPKPFPARLAGNGAHIHVSLWGTGQEADLNLFADPAQPGALSSLGQAFLAGVLAHLPGLLALTCASVNSYSRLQPHSWSSAYAVWGMDNREAALRVPSPFLGEEQRGLNLEVKCADHSANPYLALGALLAAGLDGISQQRTLPPAVQVDPGTLSEQMRAELGIVRLPGSLQEALSALADDAVLTEALGPLLLSSYLAVKQTEVAHFLPRTPEEIALAHFTLF